MKHIFFFLFSVTILFAQSSNNNLIRVNQIGYYPQSAKIAVVVNTDKTKFQIYNNNSEIVFTGALEDRVIYSQSGENIKLADFSELKKEGKYFISIPDFAESYIFEIKKNIFSNVLKATAKSFYFQRLSIPLDKKYAGKYAREAGQPKTMFELHPSTGKTGKIFSHKGWMDAGDDNRYTVNAGFSASTLMALVELYPNILADNSLNIPESGNGKNDILDEIKFELEWLTTMQDNDGGGFTKLTQKNFGGFVMPANDKSQRFVVGKSTAATLNIAGTCAMASRIYSKINKPFADSCLKIAEKSWTWAIKNPKEYFKNPNDVHTGEYGDTNVDDEFFWAAVQLYLATDDNLYQQYVEKNFRKYKNKSFANWQVFYTNLAYHSLAVTKNSLVNNEVKVIINKANKLLEHMSNSPYLIFLDKFQWGSNSIISDIAMTMCYAHYITGEEKYLNAAISNIDYIFGKNATGYSFVTGFGSKRPMHIHHRQSGADTVKAPVPGFLVGGPNVQQEDKMLLKYDSDLPAKSYMDVEESYASNEICINWNAPLVFVLGYLEMNAK